MTSYQKRKSEIKALKAKADEGAALAREVKHFFLALARGQAEHAEQCKKSVLKRAMSLWAFTETEKNEVKK